MFYFYTIYNDVANQNFFDIQKDILYNWHKEDPVDEIELSRTYAIASYQNNIPNPFVLDSSLIKRIWFFDCYEEVSSELLIENILSGFLYSNNLDINSDSHVNLIDLVHIIDREVGENAYFICD